MEDLIKLYKQVQKIVAEDEQDFLCGKPENHNNYEQGNCKECLVSQLNI